MFNLCTAARPAILQFCRCCPNDLRAWSMHLNIRHRISFTLDEKPLRLKVVTDSKFKAAISPDIPILCRLCNVSTPEA